MEKEIRFTASARKHKIGKAHALFVVENYEPTLFSDLDGAEVKWHWQGFDDRGLELEVIGVEKLDVIVVIHVMPFNFRRRGRSGN
jgi:hypothetical protein